MKKILCSAILLLLVFGLPVQAKTVSVEQEVVEGYRYTYQVRDDNTCWIMRIAIDKPSSNSILTIPSSFQGKPVTKIGVPNDESSTFLSESTISVFGLCNNEEAVWGPQEVEQQLRTVRQIVLPESLQEITDACFMGMTRLTSVNLPESLTTLGKNPFYGCAQLRQLRIPSKVSKNVEMFCSIYWTDFQISPNNTSYKVDNGFLLSRDGKRLYGTLIQMETANIPEGVTKIGYECFYGTYFKKIHIPNSVRTIEKRAFLTDTETVISISSKNKYFGLKNKCLYNKKNGLLVAAMIKDGYLKLPTKIKMLSEGTSYTGGKIKKIIIPKTVKKIKGNWLMGKTEKAKVYCYTKKVLVKNSYSFGFFSKLYVPKKLYLTYKKTLKKDIKQRYIKVYKK